MNKLKQYYNQKILIIEDFLNKIPIEKRRSYLFFSFSIFLFIFLMYSIISISITINNDIDISESDRKLMEIELITKIDNINLNNTSTDSIRNELKILENEIEEIYLK